MIKKKRLVIALIYGGRGTEREVSCGGMRFVLPLFDRAKYDVLPILIERDGRWLLNGDEVFVSRGGLMLGGEFIPIDAAFPLLHGDFGEDGVVQGALDNSLIPYVGCDTVSGGCSRDKAVMKRVAASLDIPTVPWIMLLSSDDIHAAVLDAERKLGYPMFVKPSRLGSSVGASPAENREALVSAIFNAFKYGERVILEKMLTPLRELESAYLSFMGEEIFTPPGEIRCSGFYDYDSKYLSGDIGVDERAELDSDICAELLDYASRIVRAVGIRHLSRIDFFLSEGRLYFNEINTMPGFTATSLYPRMISRAGISPHRLVNGLIENIVSKA